MGFGFLKDLISILQGKKSPNALAAGFALGAMLGLIPKGNLLGIVFFLLFFLTQVDKTAAFFAALIFTPLGYALDGLSHKLGYFLLVETQGLKLLWTTLYNAPIVPWTKFNNTVVLGNLVLGLLLFLPLFFIVKKLAVLYDAHLKVKVNSWKITQAFKALDVWQKFKPN